MIVLRKFHVKKDERALLFERGDFVEILRPGLEVDSVGVKDIILPGEMKVILAKVVEAEKAALANVIRRREDLVKIR
jgi:regulator of protease activity HflC (stomatin/prohibitin superfamily)